jgi:hypothetical protein
MGQPGQDKNMTAKGNFRFAILPVFSGGHLFGIALSARPARN